MKRILIFSFITFFLYAGSPKEIFLEAQTYAMGFYAREGFVKASEEFLEDGIPHTAMRLRLEE